MKTTWRTTVGYKLRDTDGTEVIEEFEMFSADKPMVTKEFQANVGIWNVTIDGEGVFGWYSGVLFVSQALVETEPSAMVVYKDSILCLNCGGDLHQYETGAWIHADDGMPCTQPVPVVV